MKTIIQVIVYVAVIALIVGIIAIIYKYTDGFNEEFKTFYIEYNGQQILSKETKIKLAHGNTFTVNVKYTFDKEDAEPNDYSVKVVPNVDPDFEYSVDGKARKYSSLKDLSLAFGIKKEATSFTLTLEDGLNMQSVLSKMHNGSTVEVENSALNANDYPFCLEISSYNGEITYKVLFNVVSGAVTGVTLDQAYIDFQGR